MRSQSRIGSCSAERPRERVPIALMLPRYQRRRGDSMSSIGKPWRQTNQRQVAGTKRSRAIHRAVRAIHRAVCCAEPLERRTLLAASLVKDINLVESTSSNPVGVAVGSTYYFSANDGINGAQLWKSDGTESGTVLVKG